ncbi:MAG: hypothetical protein DRO01_05430 [Thermoproteota archaeon]|nr:MAG: hypothetical protein DRO01_05430 [Candidatus Korarchaeota archaeon]
MRSMSKALILLSLLSVILLNPAEAKPNEVEFRTSISSPCYIGQPCKIRVNLTAAPQGFEITGLRLSLPW